MDPNPPLPKKRSLFTKKALSKKSHPTEDEELTFSRAKELAAERLADEERKRQKRINKVERKRSSPSAERRRSTTSADNKRPTETPPKKRKVSGNHENENGNESDSSGPAEPEEPIWERSGSSSSSSDSPPQKHSLGTNEVRRSPSDTLSARYSKSLQENLNLEQQTAKGYVSISDSDDVDAPAPNNRNMPIATDEDDDDDDDDLILVSGNLPKRPVVEALHSDDDEEFPELVQRARERERLRLEQAANASKSVSDKSTSQNVSGSYYQKSTNEVDPSIEILITSRLEGTTALRVKRKMSQRLREARYAWCDRQNLPQLSSSILKDSIFLTWKQKRVYDTTTCTALGLKSSDSASLSDEEDLTLGKVHLEAWTQETFEAFEQEEEAAREREARGEPQEDEEADAEPIVKKLRLVMKAKDLDPVKLFVKDTTILQKLVTAFRQAKNIPAEKSISLYFDGDELNLDDKVEDTELDELDTVEVHIR